MNYQLPIPTQKAIYEWSYNINADASKVGVEIEEIAEENDGQVTPNLLVIKAKSKTSEMHNLFEWDNKAAADKFRDSQASFILRNLRIRVIESQTEGGGKKEFVLRPLINVKVADGRFYSPITVVLNNSEQREYALKDLRESLMAWRRKSAMFTEFTAIHAAIDRMLVDTMEMPEVFDAVEM